MNGALDILRRERDDAAEQIRMLRVRIRELEAAIEVLEGQPVPAKASRAAGDLKQIVLSKLADFGSEGGTPKDIADALTQNGRITSDASVSSTLSRLKAESRVANRNGRWFGANSSSEAQNPQVSQTNDSEWDDVDDDVPF